MSPKRTHGKPRSECCDARLRLVQNGEWTEQYCQECGQPVHPDGRAYSYLVRDPATASVPQRPNETT